MLFYYTQSVLCSMNEFIQNKDALLFIFLNFPDGAGSL